MNVLIIEDDPIKLNAIKSFLETFSDKIQINYRMSYQSGLLALLQYPVDLVLLDMQLPNYDIKSGEDGYKPRPVAGRDILREIKRKNIVCSVIIITQYEGFGENGKLESLDKWHDRLSEEFVSIYKCTIQYKPGSETWRTQLIKTLNLY